MCTANSSILQKRLQRAVETQIQVSVAPVIHACTILGLSNKISHWKRLNFSVVLPTFFFSHPNFFGSSQAGLIGGQKRDKVSFSRLELKLVATLI